MNTQPATGPGSVLVCPYCGYQVVSRVPQPKHCSRCHKWFAPWKDGALAPKQAGKEAARTRKQGA